MIEKCGIVKEMEFISTKERYACYLPGRGIIAWIRKRKMWEYFLDENRPIYQKDIDMIENEVKRLNEELVTK